MTKDGSTSCVLPENTIYPFLPKHDKTFDAENAQLELNETEYDNTAISVFMSLKGERAEKFVNLRSSKCVLNFQKQVLPYFTEVFNETKSVF